MFTPDRQALRGLDRAEVSGRGGASGWRSDHVLDRRIMTTNIVMLTFGRPRLTEQALRTLKENTPEDAYTLTTFDDGGKLGTGEARNEAIRRSPKADYLYLSDNDVYFLPNWLEVLTDAYDYAAKFGIAALGGYCHPYHQPFEKHFFGHPRHGCEIGITYALPTQSMLMAWEIWDQYGPFDPTTPGKVNCGEDWLFTERIRKDGLRVAALYPPVVLSTSRHDSFGDLMVGHELVGDIPGVIIE